MIEIVKEGGSRVYKREIPQNVRQVGEVKGKTGIYIEDYITSFIKQVSAMNDDPKALILYGDKQVDGDETRFFVHGAVLAECNDPASCEKNVFQETVWKDVNEKAGHFFRDSMVLGWVYIRYDLSDFVEAPVLNTHKEFFREGQQIYMEYSVSERVEHMYLFEKGNMEIQSGYFVYYERNEAMQNYMVTVKQEEPEEAKAEVDKATKRFRGIVEEKKEEMHRRQTVGLLYGTSVAMLLIVTIIGVTMLHNYEKMKNMERVLYDISAQMVDEEKAAAPVAEKVGTIEEYREDDGVQELTIEAGVHIDEASLKQSVSDNLLAEEDSLAKEMISSDLSAEQSIEEQTVAERPATEQAVSEEPVLEDPLIEAQEGYIIPAVYTIEKGDTLEKISKQFYGNESMIDKICEVNGIADKNSIQYGVNIVLP